MFESIFRALSLKMKSPDRQWDLLSLERGQMKRGEVLHQTSAHSVCPNFIATGMFAGADQAMPKFNWFSPGSWLVPLLEPVIIVIEDFSFSISI